VCENRLFVSILKEASYRFELTEDLVKNLTWMNQVPVYFDLSVSIHRNQNGKIAFAFSTL